MNSSEKTPLCVTVFYVMTFSPLLKREYEREIASSSFFSSFSFSLSSPMALRPVSAARPGTLHTSERDVRPGCGGPADACDRSPHHAFGTFMVPNRTASTPWGAVTLACTVVTFSPSL